MPLTQEMLKSHLDAHDSVPESDPESDCYSMAASDGKASSFAEEINDPKDLVPNWIDHINYHDLSSTIASVWECPTCQYSIDLQRLSDENIHGIHVGTAQWLQSRDYEVSNPYVQELFFGMIIRHAVKELESRGLRMILGLNGTQITVRDPADFLNGDRLDMSMAQVSIINILLRRCNISNTDTI